MSQQSENSADPVASLLEREVIRDLKARYCRFLDTKDERSWRTIFTPDVRIRTDLAVPSADGQPTPSFTVDGADAFVTTVLASLAGVATVHHCHTPEIILTSPTIATGVWAMQDWLIYPDGKELRGAGHYHETCDKHEGEWRISSLHLTRTVVQTTGDRSGATAPR
ncbi:nuclear transport factor 2 family protein [Nocardia sp. NPDC052254]|uniref:nuclear transport factor 2 family protein n=1 Tax=Nocardia sp. NPDC052254 TaxID=3155681 RepID=UPI003431ACC2